MFGGHRRAPQSQGARAVTAALLTSLVVLLAVSSADAAWQVLLDGPPHLVDRATDVIALPGGDVVVAGQTTQTPGGQRTLTVTRRAGNAGTLVWQQEFYGAIGSAEMPVSVLSGSRHLALVDGDVIVAGLQDGVGGPSELLVLRLSAVDGTAVWRQDLDVFPGSADAPIAMAVDGAGVIHVAGQRFPDAWVLELAPASGAEIRRTIVPGFIVYDLTVACDGVAFLAGHTIVGTESDFAVVKLAAAGGGEAWRRTIDGPGSESSVFLDVATHVRLDAGGAVLVAGTLSTTSPGLPLGLEHAVLKLEPAGGTTLWQQAFTTPYFAATLVGVSGALEIDSRGDVVSAGQSLAGPSMLDVRVVKLAGSDGHILWQRNLWQTPFASEHLNLALDHADDVIFGGESRDLPPDYDQLALVKLAGPSGTIVCRRDVDGGFDSPIPNDDPALHVTAVPAGAVAAGYLTTIPFQAPDFAIVLDCAPATPTCGNGVVEVSEACDDGNFANDDCCLSTCQWVAAGGACCSDGNGCTTDTCDGAGVCVHTSVGSGPCDDGVFCNGPDVCVAGTCVNAGPPPCTTSGCRTCNEVGNACDPLPLGSVCRPAAGACDVDEFCAGAPPACPPDVVLPASTICRPPGDLCDLAESCTGASSDCPSDALVSAGTVCRPQQDDCDIADTCDGLDPACADGIAPNGTPCNDGELNTCPDTCTDGACDGPPGCLGDRFLCYATRAPRPYPTLPPTVALIDQFGAHTSRLPTPKAPSLCAPDPAARAAHLEEYRVHGQRVRVRNLRVENDLGVVHLHATGPTSLMVPTAKGFAGPPPPLALPTIDHYTCYRVRNNALFPAFTPILGVAVTDQFGQSVVDVLEPHTLCAPTDKNGEDPSAPEHPGHLLCYRVAPQPVPIGSVFTTNQFGSGTLALRTRTRLCVPSLKLHE